MLSKMPHNKELVGQEMRVYMDMCAKWKLKHNEKIVYFSGIIQKYFTSEELRIPTINGCGQTFATRLINNGEFKEIEKLREQCVTHPESYHMTVKDNPNDKNIVSGFDNYEKYYLNKGIVSVKPQTEEPIVLDPSFDNV